MIFICPYCGSEVERDEVCGNCYKEISWAKTFWKKSYAYYNEGYRAVKRRNLTIAEIYLKKAISINKFNIEARNLLGLVYYEMGQVGNALKEWIISQSLKKENNLATEYIDLIQKQPKKLEVYKESIDLYNKAINYARQKNMDMAIIRLKKAVKLNSQLVRARVLLGLCYMYDKQYTKAYEVLEQVLQIDIGNKEALSYYYELSKKDVMQEKVDISQEIKNKMTMTNVSQKHLFNRSHLFSRYIMYFVLGIIAMMLVDTYLILPTRMQEYQKEVMAITQSEEELEQQVYELSNEYNQKIAKLEENKQMLETKVSNYEVQLNLLAQQEKLVSAKALIEQGDYIEAASIIYNVASTKLDETDTNLYNELKRIAYVNANNQLYEDGISLYEERQYPGAISKFENILLYEPESSMARKALYYIGCAYMENESVDQAKKCFTKLINEYSGSYEANQGQLKLKSIED